MYSMEEVKPTIVARLTKEKEAEIFKALAHKSYSEVGKDFGLHLIYPEDTAKVTSVVFGIARKVRRAPQLWGLSEDTVEVIQEAIDKRSVKKNPKIKSDIAIMEESFRDKLDTMRDRIAGIIDKKLEKYEKKGGDEGVSIRDLKDLLIMAIDKGRLLRGESTENIKKMSPLNVDAMSPETALDIVLKAREVLIEGKK